MRTIANIRVGKPDTQPSKPAHTWGVRQGNRPHTLIGEAGALHIGHRGAGRPTGKASVNRSTGINPEKRQPIDPSMPNLTPP